MIFDVQLSRFCFLVICGQISVSLDFGVAFTPSI